MRHVYADITGTITEWRRWGIIDRPHSQGNVTRVSAAANLNWIEHQDNGTTTVQSWGRGKVGSVYDRAFVGHRGIGIGQVQWGGRHRHSDQ